MKAGKASCSTELLSSLRGMGLWMQGEGTLKQQTWLAAAETWGNTGIHESCGP